MLCELQIRNYTLIKELTIPFGNGLSIITGETGAGKSILLGALSLILGSRVEGKFLENQEEKAIIEGRFTTIGDKIPALLDSFDLDNEPEVVLRREIAPNGKSRAFINDTPVTLNQLKEVGELLVDIHSQHSNLLLNNPDFRIEFIDHCVNDPKLLHAIQMSFTKMKSISRQLHKLESERDQLQKEQDFIEFQFRELDALQLKQNEYEENEQELELLTHADKIAESLAAFQFLMEEGETPLSDLLQKAETLLYGIKQYNPNYQEWYTRMEAIAIEIKDVSNEITAALDDVRSDPERLEMLNNRQIQIQRMLRKHNLSTVEELLKLKSEINDSLSRNGLIDEQIADLKKDYKTSIKDYIDAAGKMEIARKNAAATAGPEIELMLRELGIPEAIFSIQIESLEEKEARADGLNRVHFLFSANKGMKPVAVSSNASGGEISRIMLSIKYLLADTKAFPTMIFDEIDLGISGEVAIKMGTIIKRLSEKHQIIAITHLPQIAAMGNTHYQVKKVQSDARSFSTLKILEKEERVAEIAEMIGGKSASVLSVENARELLLKFANNN